MLLPVYNIVQLMNTIGKIRQRYRYSLILLRQLVKADFKLRYQGSVLGYLWSLLRPLFIFIILYVVFVEFLKVDFGVPNPALYLLTGIVFWNYFIEVTTGSVRAVVERGDLLRKINFPKYVIILANSMSALINLALNFIVIGVFMAFSGVSPGLHTLLVVPVVMELFVFSLACAFFLSALFVRFRDIAYIWDVLIQAAFYATPILYPLSRIPIEYAGILILNPMAQIIQDARYAIVTTETPTIADIHPGNPALWLLPIGTVAVISVVAAAYFRSRSRYFAEEV